MILLEAKGGNFKCALFCLPILFFLLQGCSNTSFGQRLSNSFDSPGNSSSNKLLTNNLETTNNVSVREITPIKKTKKLVQRIPIQNSKIKPQVPLIPRDPQPYRITIRLAEADPSAPAEAVTKALRIAGVSFEVEMIERLQDEPIRKVSGKRKGVRPK